MVVKLPVAYRKSRRRPTGDAPSPVAALTLVAASASFEDDVPTVTMRFDRAIDVSAMDVATIGVGTVVSGSRYAGFGSPTLADAWTVVVSLQAAGSYAGSGTELDAGAGNGVVAADDGAAWAGVSALALPFS